MDICGIVVVLLLILIARQLVYRKQCASKCKYLRVYYEQTQPYDAILDSINKKMQGTWLTPLTTPVRRPIQTLITGNDQEACNL